MGGAGEIAGRIDGIARAQTESGGLEKVKRVVVKTKKATVSVRKFLAVVACHALTGFCACSTAAGSGCARETQEWRTERVDIFEERLKLMRRDSGLSIALIRDIYFGHVQALRRKLDAGLNADAAIAFEKPGEPIPLLELAVLAYHPAVAEILVAQGAAFNADQSHSPLLDAAYFGLDGTVTLLLSRGADPEKESEQERTALSESLRERHQSTLKILLEHGADPNHPVAAHSVLRGLEVAQRKDQEIADSLRNYGAEDFRDARSGRIFTRRPCWEFVAPPDALDVARLCLLRI